jgi:putative intracellular protease/amidase
MSDPSLVGRRVAVLATDGFEQSELERPVQALKDAGANVEIVSPKPGRSRGGSTTTRAAPCRSTAHWPTPIRPLMTR